MLRWVIGAVGGSKVFKLLKQYTRSTRDAQHLWDKLRAFSFDNSSGYIWECTYVLIAEDCNDYVWAKIGRSNDPIQRFQSYNYAEHFRGFGVKHINTIDVVGWHTPEESYVAEKYLHSRLIAFRHDAREWFTNYGTDVSSDIFAYLLEFYWASFRHAGATADVHDGKVVGVVSGRGGFPIGLVNHHRDNGEIAAAACW